MVNWKEWIKNPKSVEIGKDNKASFHDSKAFKIQLNSAWAGENKPDSKDIIIDGNFCQCEVCNRDLRGAEKTWEGKGKLIFCHPSESSISLTETSDGFYYTHIDTIFHSKGRWFVILEAAGKYAGSMIIKCEKVKLELEEE